MAERRKAAAGVLRLHRVIYEKSLERRAHKRYAHFGNNILDIRSRGVLRLPWRDRLASMGSSNPAIWVVVHLLLRSKQRKDRR
jgi:hypothetical protein